MIAFPLAFCTERPKVKVQWICYPHRGDIQWIWKDSAGETFNGFGRIRRLSFVPHPLHRCSPPIPFNIIPPIPLTFTVFVVVDRSLTHPVDCRIISYVCLDMNCGCFCFAAVAAAADHGCYWGR